MEPPNFGKTLKDILKLPIFGNKKIESCSKYLSKKDQRELFNMYVLSFMATPTPSYNKVLEILGIKDKVEKYTDENKDWKSKVKGSYYYFLRASVMINNEECQEIVQTVLNQTRSRMKIDK